MTPEQKSLVINLSLGRVSEADFRARFGVDLSSPSATILGLLTTACERKDAGDVECALILAWRFSALGPSHVDVLCTLLLAPWHTRHEDIAKALQTLRDPRAVGALTEAATTKHAYLEYDQSHALARKCTWALADIGTDAARARLLQLTRCTDETVAGYARRRLARGLRSSE